MDASKPESAIQLKEHLQYQQEPFSLDNYLCERRYMFKNSSSDCSNIRHLHSENNLKQSINHDSHKIRKRWLRATGILRSLVHKFVTCDDNQEFSNWVIEHKSNQYVHEIAAGNQTTRQTNGLSSMKRLPASDHNDVEGKVMLYEHHSSGLMNMFHTFTFPKLRRLEVDTGTKLHWLSRKEVKQQCSTEWEWTEPIPNDWKEPLPNEVCHFKTPEAPVIAISTLSQKSVGDPIFQTNPRKLLVNSGIPKSRPIGHDKLRETVETASVCRRNKRILQKRKQQLLFDCRKSRRTP